MFNTKRYLLLLGALSISVASYALDIEERADTLIAVEKVQITAIKQRNQLRYEPLASSVIGERTLSLRGVNAVKDILTDVPNLLCPITALA